MWQEGYVAERAGDGRHLEKKLYINREVGRKRVLVLDADGLRRKTGVILIPNGQDAPPEDAGGENGGTA
jgi:hypothetical protein